MTLQEAKEIIIEREKAKHVDDMIIFYPDPMNENDCAMCGKPKDKHYEHDQGSIPLFCKFPHERQWRHTDILMDEAAELYAASKVKNNSVKEVTGCINCPFNFEYDMSVGYGCKMVDGATIMQSKKYAPIDPDWCPLKVNNIEIELKQNRPKP